MHRDHVPPCIRWPEDFSNTLDPIRAAALHFTPGIHLAVHVQGAAASDHTGLLQALTPKSGLEMGPDPLGEGCLLEESVQNNAP